VLSSGTKMYSCFATGEVTGKTSVGYLTGYNNGAEYYVYIKSNLDSEGKVYILGGYGAVDRNMDEKITAGGFKLNRSFHKLSESERKIK